MLSASATTASTVSVIYDLPYFDQPISRQLSRGYLARGACRALQCETGLEIHYCQVTRAFGRSTPLELTVSPRLGETLKVEHVRQFQEMGVERIIFGAGPGAKDQIAAMEHLRDEVMTKV